MEAERDKLTDAILELYKVVTENPDATIRSMVDAFDKIELKEPLVQTSKLQGKIPIGEHILTEGLIRFNFNDLFKSI